MACDHKENIDPASDTDRPMTSQTDLDELVAELEHRVGERERIIHEQREELLTVQTALANAAPITAALFKVSDRFSFCQTSPSPPPSSNLPPTFHFSSSGLKPSSCVLFGLKNLVFVGFFSRDVVQFFQVLQ